MSHKVLQAKGLGVWALVVLSGLLVHSGEAKAWQCARVLDSSGSASGPALFWSNRNITYQFNAAGTQALDNDDALNAVRAGFAVWQNSNLAQGLPADCAGTARATLPNSTDITFTEGAVTDQNYVGYNYLNPETNKNVILFRDMSWPHPLTGPSSDLVALTTVTYNPITGELLDADIEINTADFTLSVGDTNVAWDLLGVAVHEIGHLLGFDDSLVADAAMYSMTNRGEVNKRFLSCDDAALLWYRYPTGTPTSTCAVQEVNAACGMCAAPGNVSLEANVTVRDAFDGHSGCSCSSTMGAQGAVVTVLAVVGRIWRRRRRMSPERASP